ncbi:MAG: MlaD family protein [Pseudomonadota bacterium]|nr:MCE family protein [Gammaproteobacteria bacterium]MBU1558290.1 MCE family protein [Gammaproteobacteria bacterium]MBU1629200.1 MCE family protein [Gammaproteobacteria bacterium]MBU1926755.1 MCE family protein [Gammaproteobacteria bacterium]MBU2546267.1 MCE family protein [Gammaproteobacteria bacterium]
MKSNSEANYLRIGTFVILGITLLIVVILVLGSGVLFRKELYVETYFDDSVQGLSEGSPVKYRGLNIGHVKTINFVNRIYKNKNKGFSNEQYIYVVMAITHDFLTNGKSLSQNIAFDVKKGLRVKLALQGLTGNAYLEIDFMNPRTNPSLPVYWRPKYLYIPSATSTLTKFSENVEYILDELKQVKITALFNDMHKLVNNTDQTVSRINGVVTQSQQEMNDAVSNLQTTSENLRVLSARAKDYPSSVLFGAPPPRLDPNQL